MKLSEQRYQRKIDVRLTNDELAVLADELAKLDAQRREVEQEKREETSRFTDTIKEIKGAMKSLSDKIIAHVERREVDVIATPDEQRFCVVIRRADTGELLEERKMTDEEIEAVKNPELPGLVNLEDGDHQVDAESDLFDEDEDEDGEPEARTGGVIVEDATPSRCENCGSWELKHTGDQEGICAATGAVTSVEDTCEGWCPMQAAPLTATDDPAPRRDPCADCSALRTAPGGDPDHGTCRLQKDRRDLTSCDAWERKDVQARAAAAEAPCRSKKDGRRCSLEDGHAGPHFAEGVSWQARRRRVDDPAAA